MTSLVPVVASLVLAGVPIVRDPDTGEISAPLPASAKALTPGRVADDVGESLLVVRVDGPKPGPALFGRYERRGDALVFRPSVPFTPDQPYRVTAFDGGKPIASIRIVVHRVKSPAPRVTQIYPSAPTLPANTLRFSVRFSQPMRGGAEIFRQIEIRDAQGEVVADPWLLDELWDVDGQWLVIYIHPGRIKWGVALRETIGPVLLPDREYAFVVKQAMLGANGSKLEREEVYRFRTSAEDRKRVDLSRWKLGAPAVGTTEPLGLTFPQSLDHQGVKTRLAVVDAAGVRVPGEMVVGAEEKRAEFRPKGPWTAGEFRVRVDGTLEDVAGNTPLRPFDVHLRDPLPPPQPLDLPFRPRVK